MGGPVIDVIRGPVAFRIGKYWVGVASGNRYTRQHRKTAQRALADAAKLEDIKGCPKCGAIENPT